MPTFTRSLAAVEIQDRLYNRAMADRIVCSCVTCPGCGTWVVVEPEIARAGGSNN
jgi:hypothetical protein